jgi:hypothetical protein
MNVQRILRPAHVRIRITLGVGELYYMGDPLFAECARLDEAHKGRNICIRLAFDPVRPAPANHPWLFKARKLAWSFLPLSRHS